MYRPAGGFFYLLYHDLSLSCRCYDVIIPLILRHHQQAWPGAVGLGHLRTNQQVRPRRRCPCPSVRGRTSGQGPGVVGQARPRWPWLSANGPAGPAPAPAPLARSPLALPSSDGPAGAAQAPLSLAVRVKDWWRGAGAVSSGRHRMGKQVCPRRRPAGSASSPSA